MYKKIDWEYKRPIIIWANWAFQKVLAFALGNLFPLIPIQDLVVEACIGNSILHTLGYIPMPYRYLDHKDIPIELIEFRIYLLNPLVFHSTFSMLRYFKF